MSDWNSSDDWPSETPRASPAWRLLLLGGLVGGLLVCIALFVLLRWPLTGQFLWSIFAGGNQPRPLATLSVTPAGAISATPSVRNRTDSPAVASVVKSQETIAVPATRAAVIPTPARTARPSAIGAPPSPQPSLTQKRALQPPDLEGLRAVMLEAINADRKAQGLSAVNWDTTAALAGQAHAEAMLANGYFSHWDLAGYGPEHRYAQVGGVDAVAENIYMYWYRYDNGQPALIEDWGKVIREAEANLMNSPGHRRNILDPFHTHVGVGIAYDAQKGELRLAQEFVNRWVQIDLRPGQLAIGGEVKMIGVLLSGATNPVINLAYQPFPSAMSAQNAPSGSYRSAAETYSALNPDVTGQQFVSQFRIGQQDQKGLYSVRTWVEVGGQSVLASEIILWAD